MPIGNLTSQFWANVYLDPLDQFVKRELKCEGYVRYVDDFLLFADDKRDLHRWKKSIIEFAASLRLKLHERESVVFPVTTGIPFLGWREYPDHRRLKQRNALPFNDGSNACCFHSLTAKIKWKDVDASVQSWVAHAAHGQTYGLRRALLGGVILPSGGMKESPIFSKTYDFVAWLIPLTVKFPRQQRFVLAAALQREALQFQSLLIEAAHQRQPRGGIDRRR